MYEAFFEMTGTPFARNIPPEQLYENRSLREILGRLMYVADRKLFAVVTSDPGCGKSTLLRRFEAMLPKEKYILLYLSDSKLTPKWFYKGLLEQLGMESGFYRGDAKKQLQLSIPACFIPSFRREDTANPVDKIPQFRNWILRIS